MYRLPFISHLPLVKGLVTSLAYFSYWIVSFFSLNFRGFFLSAFYYILNSLEIGHHYGIYGNLLRQEMECIGRLRGVVLWYPRVGKPGSGNCQNAEPLFCSGLSVMLL